MMRPWLGRLTAVLLVAVLPWVAAPAAAAPAPQLAPVGQGRGARAVEAGLSFLAERYATPLEPAHLLQAGWTGIAETAATAGEPVKVQVAAVGTAPIAGDRAAAWAEFQQRFD